MIFKLILVMESNNCLNKGVNIRILFKSEFFLYIIIQILLSFDPQSNK